MCSLLWSQFQIQSESICLLNNVHASIASVGKACLIHWIGHPLPEGDSSRSVNWFGSKYYTFLRFIFIYYI